MNRRADRDDEPRDEQDDHYADGLRQRVGDLRRVLVAGEPVDAAADPALLALGTAGLHEPGIVGRLREHDSDVQGPRIIGTTCAYATGRSSLTRWLTTRLEPPGGIDTP